MKELYEILKYDGDRRMKTVFSLARDTDFCWAVTQLSHLQLENYVASCVHSIGMTRYTGYKTLHTLFKIAGLTNTLLKQSTLTGSFQNINLSPLKPFLS